MAGEHDDLKDIKAQDPMNQTARAAYSNTHQQKKHSMNQSIDSLGEASIDVNPRQTTARANMNIYAPTEVGSTFRQLNQQAKMISMSKSKEYAKLAN